MKVLKSVILVFTLLFLFNFVFAADSNLRINTALNSVDIDGRFVFETNANSEIGFDQNDLEDNSAYSNYSSLISVVGAKNLIVDSRPSGQAHPYIPLTYTVDSGQTGDIIFSWDYSNQEYQINLYDYGNDSSRINLVGSVEMTFESSYVAENFQGGIRYLQLAVSYSPSSTGSGSDIDGTGPTNPLDCGEFVLIEEGECSYHSAISGTKVLTYEDSCGNESYVAQNCCVVSQTATTWGSCSPSGTRAGVYDVVNEDCSLSSVPVTSLCSYGCQEDWQCVYNGCKVISCVDLNSCGTEDDRPGSLSCSTTGTGGGSATSGSSTSALKVKENCDISLKCEKWTTCEVDSGFDDIKGVEPGTIGSQTRKCVDTNGCLDGPYFEERSCSVKVFLETKDKIICDEKYIDVYKRNSDFLVARIKDERKTKKSLSMFFTVDGKEPEIKCEQKEFFIYNLNFVESTLIALDFRNSVEALFERL